MKIHIRQKITNMSLNKKFMAIVMVVVAAMTLAASIAINMIDDSYQTMLYQTLQESLEYSSEEIVDYMQKMEDLTMMMLSDEEMQMALNNVKNEDANSLAAMNAIRELRSNVGLYYQTFSDGILQYITLYTDLANAYTNILDADKVPKSVQNQMVQKADENRGKPCWITDYVEEYGFFLGRSVNSIQSYKMERLGTILLQIDMEDLIRSETKLSRRYADTAYVICDGDGILFHTANLSKEGALQVKNAGITGYAILEMEEHSYFTVCGKMDKYDWDYYCLVSYDAMKEHFVQARMVCLLIILFVLCFASGFSYYLLNSIMRHVSRLTEKMQQFAKDNTRLPEIDYDYTAREDELGVLHRQFDRMSETIIRLIQDNYINELIKKETQIKALENQINPHFLYNTLESVKWRAKSAGETEISDMVEALGTLLHTTLSNKDESVYSLGKEMEVIDAYITIQKLRYEDRLHFDNQISQLYYPIRIPKLSIQPLIENAIYYGVEANFDGSQIELSLKVKDGIMYFQIKNTGSEMEEELLEKLTAGEIVPKGHGIGLLNIDKRVKMQFGESYGLSLYNDEEYAIAELRIPVDNGEKLYVETDNSR